MSASTVTARSSGLFRLFGLGASGPIDEADPAACHAPWYPVAALLAALGLLLAAFAANQSRQGGAGAFELFYGAVFLIVFPAALNLILPHTSRGDRIATLMALTLGLFGLRIVRAPLYFIDHDEYLHWDMAQNLMETGRLFIVNTLFPIGQNFPGLAILTAALGEMSGLSIHAAGLLILGAARVVFVGSLFLFAERLTRSARAGGLCCLFYMACSTFVFFDTHFAYQSIALPLMAFVLWLDVRIRDARPAEALLLLLVALATLMAISATHHMTSYATAAILVLVAVFEIRRGTPLRQFARSAILAYAAVTMPLLWSSSAPASNSSYLGPLLSNGLNDLLAILQFEMPRKLFTGQDGEVAPLWQRVVTLGSVALISAGLGIGFVKSLAWNGPPLPARGGLLDFLRYLLLQSRGRQFVISALAIGFPLSIVFRLTSTGWEIGNRITPFAYLGVGLVLANLTATTLQGRSRSPLRAAVLAAAAGMAIVGGIISGEGRLVLVPSRYLVSADAASVEPMGIDAARWTREWLGPRQRFAADRIARLLLAVHGHQQVSTTLHHGYDAGQLLTAPALGPTERDMLHRLELDYILADLRLTTGRSLVGTYFDGGLSDQMLSGPPSPRAFLKFNDEPGVHRVFDNGHAVIYDVRALR
ncbi:hypothetical protein [uncultured Alsobacter sp.]|uniref:hypothetical protein n=1 Tax=uncultured Alsobacter sp. TaxID=1748258 RepID=UPI0025CD80D9|nr:hypothetical protein [uncultured Alsobacter sp.]